MPVSVGRKQIWEDLPEVGYHGAGDDDCLGSFANGQRHHNGHQVVEWAKGEPFRFLETYHRQDDRDTWYHPHDGRAAIPNHTKIARFEIAERSAKS